MEYIQKNPCARVGNFKGSDDGGHQIDYYTAEEFKRFIAASKECALQAEGHGNHTEWHYYVFFSIAFYTGMRKGEIHALRWSDINDQHLTVARSITQKLKGDDRETLPKNKTSIRTLQLPSPLICILNEHKARCEKIEGFSGDCHICGMFRSLRDTTIQLRNQEYAGLAGVKTLRIHDFRHSHASLLVNEGINIQEVARRLGHSKIELTWNTYSHLYPREEERAINILNKIV